MRCRTLFVPFVLSQLVTGCVLDESIEPIDESSLESTDSELSMVVGPVGGVGGIFIDWPFAHYPLDGTGDNVLGGNDAVNYGARRHADRDGDWGAAMWFDGSAYMEVPSNASFRKADLTVSLFFRADTMAFAPNRLCGAAGLVTNHTNFDLRLQSCRTNPDVASLRFSYMATNGQWVDLWSNTNLVERRWYHVAATRDAGGYVRLYVDGALVSSRPAPNPYMTYRPVFFGKVGSGSNFPGRLDEVRFYSSALSASAIATLAND